MESDDGSSWSWRGALTLTGYVVAASAVWDLPYFLLGPLRPVALEVFGLSNLEAGIATGIYGFSSLALSAPGGLLADRFQPGLLICLGLMLTGVGGFYMASFPVFIGLCCLMVFWAVSTTLIYWSAAVKVIRDWGLPARQNWSWAAFSASSGLISVIKLALVVEYFDIVLPRGTGHASLLEKRSALQSVIWITSAFTCMTAIVVFSGFSLRDTTRPQEVELRKTQLIDGLPHGDVVFGSIKIWLICSMLLTSYFCRSVVNYIPQFAIHGYRMDAVNAARIATIDSWTKPFVAFSVGVFADRIRCSVVCALCLFSLFIAFLVMGCITPGSNNTWELLIFVMVISVAGNATGSIFWAILQEARIPTSVTGSVVGVVSFVGYSPDSFSPPLVGYIMDWKPGLEGDQYTILVGAAFAFIGLCTTIWFMWLLKTEAVPDMQRNSEEAKLLAERS